MGQMIICADDFGISPAVSAGIIELLEQGRLSSTSCMMIGDDIENSMNLLKQVKKPFDCGLHLILTNDKPLTDFDQKSGMVDKNGLMHSFNKLLMHSFIKILDTHAIKQEVIAQLKKFVQLWGRFPDYIDGHQHVQQLPQIRQVIIDVINESKPTSTPFYIRKATLPYSWLLKKLIFFKVSFAIINFFINLLGRSFGKLLEKNNIDTNRYLIGHYNYEGGMAFSEIVRIYLELTINERDLLFCHPGFIDEALKNRDSLVNSRLDVYNYLKSDEFLQTMNENKLTVNRFQKH